MSLFKRWRVGGLLLSWALYWLALIAVSLGPGIVAGWLATHAPENTSNIGVSFGSAGLSITVTQYGDTVWSLAASLSAIAFWIAVPPILLTIWWLNRSRHIPDATPQPPEIGSGAAVELDQRTRERVHPSDRR